VQQEGPASVLADRSFVCLRALEGHHQH